MPESLIVCGVTILSLRSLMAKCLTRHSDSPAKNLLNLPQSESKTINDEVKVSLYGNTAVVTVLSTWSGKANNEAYSSQFQATHVWVKQEGRWQLVAAHVSPVKK
jgi:ketosteroid isomerase-like protein